jgi:putative solute:sodium symporter small subunit
MFMPFPAACLLPYDLQVMRRAPASTCDSRQSRKTSCRQSGIELQTVFVCRSRMIGDKTMEANAAAYWRATLGLLSKILVVWFLCSFGAGILFAEALNNIHLGGYPLGFWFAHQGSIYIFIALIFYYAKKMGDIDRQFDVHE